MEFLRHNMEVSMSTEIQRVKNQMALETLNKSK